VDLILHLTTLHLQAVRDRAKIFKTFQRKTFTKKFWTRLQHKTLPEHFKRFSFYV